MIIFPSIYLKYCVILFEFSSPFIQGTIVLNNHLYFLFNGNNVSVKPIKIFAMNVTVANADSHCGLPERIETAHRDGIAVNFTIMRSFSLMNIIMNNIYDTEKLDYTGYPCNNAGFEINISEPLNLIWSGPEHIPYLTHSSHSQVHTLHSIYVYSEHAFITQVVNSVTIRHNLF